MCIQINTRWIDCVVYKFFGVVSICSKSWDIKSVGVECTDAESAGIKSVGVGWYVDIESEGTTSVGVETV